MNTYQSNRRWLVLLRHAEALKNIENRHGGDGTSLTQDGEIQAMNAASWLFTSNIDIKIAWYSKQPQVIETLSIIKKKVKLQDYCHDNLAPLNLGNLAGLSLTEAIQKFPTEAHQMEKWRKGELEVQELQLPGGESPISFYERGLSFFKNILCNQQENTLLLSSRSVLILMLSILLGRTPAKGGGYVEIPMNTCARFVFYLEGEDWHLSRSMSNGQIEL